MQMLLTFPALACRPAWFMAPAAFSAYPAGVLASISALPFPAALDAPETRGGCTAFPSSGMPFPGFHVFHGHPFLAQFLDNLPHIAFLPFRNGCRVELFTSLDKFLLPVFPGS